MDIGFEYGLFLVNIKSNLFLVNIKSDSMNTDYPVKNKDIIQLVIWIVSVLAKRSTTSPPSPTAHRPNNNPRK